MHLTFHFLTTPLTGPHHTKSRQKRRLPVCSAKSPEECNSSREKRAAKRAKKIEDPEDDVFEVEAIVAHRLVRVTREKRDALRVLGEWRLGV